MDIKERVAAVRGSLGLTAPYCSGTLTIPLGDFKLYYDIDKETARKIDLVNATPDHLEKFANACQPATFGRNQEDVYDETYRKALKLDTTAFSTPFSAERAGLVDVVRRELLEDEDDNREIRLEMYKLNIYGKDSFFKLHKDTPQDETMFGSLVIIFPTAHEGGELVLREGENEWTLDFANMLSQSSESSNPRIAYVAFYSDVEHEVKTVKSGYRVTLTYNIYFTGEQSPVPLTSTAPSPHQAAITDSIAALVADPALLPKGGYIGFGLRHQYPVSDEMILASLKTSLKGSDATLSRALTLLSLEWRLCVLYRKVAPCDINFLSTSIVNLASYGEVADDMIYDAMGRNAETVEFVDMTGAPIKKKGLFDDEDEDAKPMFQVTEMLKEFTMTSQYLAYGNQPELAHLYGDLCLVAEIPAKEASV